MPETTHPSFAGTSVLYSSEQLPEDPDQATARTIGVMRRYIQQDAAHPLVQAAVSCALPPVVRDPMDILAAVFRWVKQRVRFRPDQRIAAEMAERPAEPFEIELLIRPVDLLRMRPAEGDCDDFAMLTAAMLTAAGIPCQLVTIAADQAQPHVFSHVYVEAVLGDRTVALDTSHGPHLGWEYPKATRRQVWRLTQRTMNGFEQWEMFKPDPPATATTNSFSWGGLVNTLAKGGMNILQSRYGQPPEGTYIQQGENILYRQQAGSGPLNFPTVSIGTPSNSSTILILGAAALAVVLIASRR